jgi:hypothetical protein
VFDTHCHIGGIRQPGDLAGKTCRDEGPIVSGLSAFGYMIRRPSLKEIMSLAGAENGAGEWLVFGIFRPQFPTTWQCGFQNGVAANLGARRHLPFALPNPAD